MRSLEYPLRITCRPPGWGVRETVDRVLGAVPSAIEIADYALMLKLVQGNFGTTLMPASAIAAGPAGVRAVPVYDVRLRWSLSAAVSASRPSTAATTAVLHALSQAACPSLTPAATCDQRTSARVR
jgi:DNA-binding transcriptional LysR family regulator